MICAETFGCSGKIGYLETKALATAVGTNIIGDCSKLGSTAYVTSIDRVSRCAADWTGFARIAFAHAARDVEAGYAKPFHANICFEFGADADENDRLSLTLAVKETARNRGVELGKCHSSVTTSEVSSIVLSITGIVEGSFAPLSPNGRVWLSRPLGLSKLLYLENLRQASNLYPIVERLSAPIDISVFHNFSAVSDVSGHGLAGCLGDLASRHGIRFAINLSDSALPSEDVMSRQITLLENDPNDFPLKIFEVDNSLKSVAFLKETAGPVVALSGEIDAQATELLKSRGWMEIGVYTIGPAHISIKS